MIELDQTERGFSLGNFKDANGVECSIQDSSVATEPMLWLGPNGPNPKVLVFNEGWVPAEIPDGIECTTRMHLTSDQCVELVKVLNRFIETGSTAE